MGWKCAPQVMGLVRQNHPKGKHRANGKAIALEAGKERISQSDTLDRELSHFNKYEGYSSGMEAWLDIEKQAEEYRSRYTDKNGVEKERKLKADAVVGFAVIFNPPEEICSSWSDDEYEKFYNDSWEALAEIEPRLFRTENIVLSAEHYDEGIEPTANGETPKDRHKHHIGVSKDENGRFCGNLIDAKLLSTINLKYPALMRSRGWDMDDLDVTDWDKYKNDEKYREERKKALSKHGKSVNEHIKRQLKAEKSQIERNKEFINFKAEDLSAWEKNLIKRENSVYEHEKSNNTLSETLLQRENMLKNEQEQLEADKASYKAKIKAESDKAYKSQREALQAEFDAKKKAVDDNNAIILQAEREKLQKEFEQYRKDEFDKMKASMNKHKAEYKNKKEAEFQQLQDELEAQNKVKLEEALKEQVSDVKEYRQWKRSKSASEIVTEQTQSMYDTQKM